MNECIKPNKEKVEHYFRLLMTEGLGLNLLDPNLKGTPERVARMYCEELFPNCFTDFGEATSFPNEKKYDQTIVLDNIWFASVCSHHFLPFTGKLWTAYIPGELLVGASKPARITAHYAARPQLQENLIHEVLNKFVEEVQPRAAMIYARAIHGCMKCRGVRQYAGSGMGGCAIYGLYHTDPSAKSEALQLIQMSMTKDDL